MGICRAREKYRMGKNVLVSSIVICILTASICAPAMAETVALQAGDAVTVTVNAPEYVEEGETFDVTIDVDDIVDFNSAQFDLSFDSSVVSVTDVKDGEIDGETVSIFMWVFVDADTIRVLVSIPMGVGVSGSGCIAKVSFEVVGVTGDRSELDISEGLLVDKEAEEIPAVWIDAEVTVGSLFDPWVYDINGDGKIDKSEAIDAVQDYFEGEITKEQAIEVIQLYFAT